MLDTAKCVTVFVEISAVSVTVPAPESFIGSIFNFVCTDNKIRADE